MYKLLLSVASALVLLSSCVTPMDPMTIRKLTVCKNTTAAQIKKNLMLMGYKIDKSDGEDFQTDFLQASNNWGAKVYRAINVVSMGNGDFKFSVRERKEQTVMQDVGASTTTRNTSATATGRVDSARATAGVNSSCGIGASASCGTAVGSAHGHVREQEHTRHSEARTIVDEYNLEYYEENYSDYKKMQSDICGR